MKYQTYSIKDLENFTQIKAHTLRIWESRYGLLKPKRTETNIRYYVEDDLKRILNVNLLYTNGFKISKIARMSDQEMVRQTQILIESTVSRHAAEIDHLMVAILHFDGDTIQSQFAKSYNELGMMEFYKSIVLPLLQKIGNLWQVNVIEVAHEHFFSNLYRNFIIDALNLLPAPHKNANKALLFLHREESHELSLLMNQYLLREKGYSTVYLGQNVPIESVTSAIRSVEPHLIVSTFVNKMDPKYFQEIVSSILPFSKKSRILISGSQATLYKNELPDNFLLIESPEQFISQL